MKGMYFGEILVKIFGILLFVEGMLHAMHISFEPRLFKSQNTSDVAGKHNKTDVRDIIQLVSLVVILLGGVIGILYLILSYKVKVVSYFIIILGGMFCGIAFFMSVIEFVQYILIKPYDYKLTRDKENTLWLIGLLAFIACYALVESGAGKLVEQYMTSLKEYQVDIIYVLLLMFWYFSITFFPLMFLILSMHKIVILFKHLLGNRKRHATSENCDIKKKDHVKLSETVLSKISAIPKRKWIKKTWFNLVWYVCTLYESLIMILLAILDMTKKIVFVSVLFIPMLIKKGVQRLIKVLEQNQGRGIILTSRISLVSSLLVIYLIDKYQRLFSDRGSEVYEFFCSVIIIPFLITQLSELKKRTDSKNEGKLQEIGSID